MNCHEFEEAASAFLDGELASEDRMACEAHLRSCAGCRRAAEDLAAISGRLRTWDEPGASAGFEAQLAARLAPTTPAAAGARRRLQALAACAASFLLGCGLTCALARGQQRTVPGDAKESSASRPGPRVETIALAPSVWSLPPSLLRPEPPAERPKTEEVVLASSEWSFRGRTETEMKRRSDK